MKYVLVLIGLFLAIFGVVALVFRLDLFENTPPLHLAAVDQDWAEVDRLLAEGADPNEPFPEGIGTVLHLAVRFGPEATVRGLLDAGADPNAVDGSGNSSLHFAVRHNRTESVRLLLEYGADPGIANSQGVTPAVMERNLFDPAIGEMLAAAGAPLEWGDTAAREMGDRISMGDIEGVRELLDHGVSPDVEISGDVTPFRSALMACRPGIARLLARRGADTSASRLADWTVFMQAIERENLPTIEALFEFGLDPNETTSFGVSPLVIAEMRGLDDIADVMVENGAERLWDGLDDPAIYRAVMDGDEAEVAEALADGSDPNAPGPYGLRPLILAVRFGRSAVALQLLEAGADPDVKQRDGLTPLHVAASHGDVELVTELLDHGAFVNSDDGRAATPLVYAREAGHDGVAALLEERGGRDTAIPLDLGILPFEDIEKPEG
jgi:ankyrin repeat protein